MINNKLEEWINSLWSISEKFNEDNIREILYKYLETYPYEDKNIGFELIRKKLEDDFSWMLCGVFCLEYGKYTKEKFDKENKHD